MSRTAILFSSGKESIWNLHKERQMFPHQKIHLYQFNYDNKSHRKEKEGLEYYANKYNCSWDVLYQFMDVPLGITAGLGEKNHVHARNLLFLARVVNLHYDGNPTRILFGATKSPKGDDSSTFYMHMLNAMFGIESHYHNLTFDAHTKYYYADEMFYLLHNARVDCSKLWSCDRDEHRMCGRCPKCEQNKALDDESPKKGMKYFKSLYADGVF
jgi:7-cyano-7-deazaguanine synthase in queuosine biosynthesis